VRVSGVRVSGASLFVPWPVGEADRRSVGLTLVQPGLTLVQPGLTLVQPGLTLVQPGLTLV
jgi:hypothetical protein